MAFIRNKIKSTSIALKLFCAVVIVALVSCAFVYLNKDSMDVKGESAVNLSSKDYMSVILDRMSKGIQKDFTILEIVPYQGSGEYRYFCGSAEVEAGLLAKSKNELKRIHENAGGNTTTQKDTWKTIAKYYSSYKYKIKYNYRADKYDIGVDPIFQNEILTDNAQILLDGKVKVNTVEANDLTEADIKNADLIVFTGAPSSENVLKAYNYYTGHVVGSGDADNTTAVYKHNGAGYQNLDTNKYAEITYDTYELVGSSYVSRDISWEMAKKVLQVLGNGRDLKGNGTRYVTPVIINENVTASPVSHNTNMYKLATIIKVIDSSKYNHFLENHITTVDAYGRPIMNGNVQTVGFKYTNGSGYTNILTTFSTGNITYSNIYPESDYVTKSTSGKCRVANNYILQSKSDSVLNFNNTLKTDKYEGLSERGLNNQSFAKAIRYLIGCKDSYTIADQISEIRVLEIQPSNSFDFSNITEVAEALGVEASKVSYDRVSTKTLNCLTEDIIAAYDVIYIGINDDKMTKMHSDSSKTLYNDKNLNGYIYLAYGDLVKGSSALMGLFEWEYKKYTGGVTNLSNVWTGNDINEYNYFDGVNGNQFIGTSFSDWKDHHSGLIIASKLPKNPRYDGVLHWKDNTNYNGDNDATYNQLKINYMYIYNNATKIIFNKHQQEFMSDFDNRYVYGVIDIKDYYSSYIGATYDGVMDDLFAKQVGNCRLSDNDITQKTANKIKEYAKSGKLIILDDTVYARDSYKIYPTSHMYELVEYLTSEYSGANCIKYSDAKYSVATHVNVKAPILTFATGGKPTELSYTSGVVNMPTSVSNVLNFKFKTNGLANTSYKVKVIIDKNGDGRYADNGYMVTDDSNEIYKTQVYQTNASGEANLSISVRLPDDENGLVAYKLEVVQMENGVETNLRSALYGYTVVKSNEPPREIKVLQILPYKQQAKSASGNLDMSYKLNAYGTATAADTYFKNAMAKVDPNTVGYKLSIQTMYSYEFENKFNPNKGGKKYTLGQYGSEADYLSKQGYDMVIIGFGDSYLMDDISNIHGAMDCINDFIANDNAVMFSHDTMSFCTTNNYGMVTKDGNGLYRAQYTFLNNGSVGNASKICQSISQNLRNIVGLDRYGATIATTDRGEKDKPTYANGLAPTYSQRTDNKSTDGKYYVEELHGFTDWNLWREGVIQYWAPNDQYSGMRLYNPYISATGISTGSDNRGAGESWWTNSRDVWASDWVDNINQGQITMFPFDIPDMLPVASTHAQYYQLDLEDEEVIVWYTMYSGSSGHYYNVNRKDGRNQYYIYSKGSVTYTGAGHSKIGNSEDELRLFINTIIMTIGAANSAPKITVTNGSMAGTGKYNIYADAVDSYQIKFKVTDPDLTTLSATDGRYEELGRYKSGQVIWDKNRDGVFNAGDVVLEKYGELSSTGKELYNDVINTVDVMSNPNLSAADKNTIRTQMNESRNIQFIIQATDSRNSSTTSLATISLKPLFNID